MLAQAHVRAGQAARALDLLQAHPTEPRVVAALGRTSLDEASRLYESGKGSLLQDDDEERFREALDVLKRIDGIDLLPKDLAGERDVLVRKLEGEL